MASLLRFWLAPVLRFPWYARPFIVALLVVWCVIYPMIEPTIYLYELKRALEAQRQHPYYR